MASSQPLTLREEGTKELLSFDHFQSESHEKLSGEKGNEISIEDLLNTHPHIKLPSKVKPKVYVEHFEGTTYAKLRYRKPDTDRINEILVCLEHGCEKTFNRKFNMEGHIRVHTGQRPFCCRHCDLSFKQIGHLMKHYESRKHTQMVKIAQHDCNSLSDSSKAEKEEEQTEL